MKRILENQTTFLQPRAEFLYDTSIRLIRNFEDVALSRHPYGYVVGYSGGKDSDVLLELFKAAGVKFYVIHNHTTIDAPETVYYIRKKFAKLEEENIPCKIYYPKTSFWQLCEQKLILPLRQSRFCCAELKEKEIPDLRFATHSFGVRRTESVRRAINRDSLEMRNRKDYKDFQKFHFDNSDDIKETGTCYTQNYFIVNPIAYWDDKEIWDYIGGNNLETNPLYSRGFCRVGCIGCPMAGSDGRVEEFRQYPKYKNNYIKLCDRIMKKRIKKGLFNKHNLKSGQDYFDYWMEISSCEEFSDDFNLFNYEEQP